MTIALYVSLGILLVFVALSFLHRPPNWVVYGELVAFIVYELLNLIYHPLVGSMVIAAAVFIGVLLFIDRNDSAILPKWWKPFLYFSLLLFSVSLVYQAVEVFTGRLF